MSYYLMPKLSPDITFPITDNYDSTNKLVQIIFQIEKHYFLKKQLGNNLFQKILKTFSLVLARQVYLRVRPSL